MTCIDSDMLATAAAEAELDVPIVLKRDRGIEHFRQLLGAPTTLAMIEEATLPNTLGDPDRRGMMERMAQSLTASFPGVPRVEANASCSHLLGSSLNNVSPSQSI